MRSFEIDARGGGVFSYIKNLDTLRDQEGVWNNLTRSRDGASSSDDNSDTGPENPGRDQKDTPFPSADDESVLSHG